MVKSIFKKYHPLIICLLLALISIIVRIPDFSKNDYHNSDATWHILHTFHCYDETPASVHKFLPIVTSGDSADKFIPWGASVPDEYGNYYYTSFSPASFVPPYLFIKLFQLPIDVISLYIFNSILLILCFIFTAKLFCKLFNTIDKKYIWYMSAAIYLFQPEIMHGQGVVYWAQSLYQLILLLQLNLLFSEHTRKRYIAMLILSLIGAYTEWTGFCANFGIALVYLFIGECKKHNFRRFLGILASTVLGFVLFCYHYLQVLDVDIFISAMISRFNARNVVNTVPLSKLMQGYFTSFSLFIIITTLCILYCLLSKTHRNTFFHSLKTRERLFFVTIIVLLENIIMKEHAISYSFDRMKLIILLLALFFCTVETFMLLSPNVNRTMLKTLILLFLCGMLNLISYQFLPNSYIKTNESYLTINQNIADNIYLKFNKDNSIMICNDYVRGYLSTIFKRGMYEYMDIDKFLELPNKSDKEYIVEIKPNEGYAYYSVKTNKITYVSYDNGNFIEETQEFR